MSDKRKLSCYLAGAFTQWDEHSDWRDPVIEKLENVITFYDPRVHTDQGSIATVVSQDLAGVESCSCVFYFLTNPTGDVGATMECAHANARGKLVILCIAEGVSFVHPFVIGTARRVLIGLDAGIAYLENLAERGIKNELEVAYETLRSSNT